MTYHLPIDRFADGHAVREHVTAMLAKWKRLGENFLDSLSDPPSLGSETVRPVASDEPAERDFDDDGEFVVLFEPGSAAPAVYQMHRLPRARGEGLRAVAREFELQSEAVARPVLVSFAASPQSRQ